MFWWLSWMTIKPFGNIWWNNCSKLTRSNLSMSQELYYWNDQQCLSHCVEIQHWWRDDKTESKPISFTSSEIDWAGGLLQTSFYATTQFIPSRKIHTYESGSHAGRSYPNSTTSWTSSMFFFFSQCVTISTTGTRAFFDLTPLQNRSELAFSQSGKFYSQSQIKRRLPSTQTTWSTIPVWTNWTTKTRRLSLNHW